MPGPVPGAEDAAASKADQGPCLQELPHSWETVNHEMHRKRPDWVAVRRKEEEKQGLWVGDVGVRIYGMARHGPRDT